MQTYTHACIYTTLCLQPEEIGEQFPGLAYKRQRGLPEQERGERVKAQDRLRKERQRDDM